MSNGYNGSRSPVRALNSAAHPAWAASLPRPRAWGEPTIHAVAAPTALAGAPDSPLLACPDCGSLLHLALVPVNGFAQPVAPAAHQPAVDDGAVPDFEESVVRFKRDLIAHALEENEGVMTRAAKALGLKYTTFVAMVHRLELATPDSDEAGTPD